VVENGDVAEMTELIDSAATDSCYSHIEPYSC